MAEDRHEEAHALVDDMIRMTRPAGRTVSGSTRKVRAKGDDVVATVTPPDLPAGHVV